MLPAATSSTTVYFPNSPLSRSPFLLFPFCSLPNLTVTCYSTVLKIAARGLRHRLLVDRLNLFLDCLQQPTLFLIPHQSYCSVFGPQLVPLVLFHPTWIPHSLFDRAPTESLAPFEQFFWFTWLCFLKPPLRTNKCFHPFLNNKKIQIPS